MRFLLLLLLTLVVYSVEPQIYMVAEHRVIDGDTIEVVVDLGFDLKKKTTVRIMGVNTPEKTGAEKAAGLIVTDLVIKWIGSHKIYCKYVKDDKYGGRIDGDIIRDDDIRLSQWLIQNKLAKAYNGEGAMPRFTESEILVISQIDISQIK